MNTFCQSFVPHKCPLPVRDLKKKKKKYLRGDGGKVPGIRGVFRQNSFRRAFGDGDEGVDERHASCVCV